MSVKLNYWRADLTLLETAEVLRPLIVLPANYSFDGPLRMYRVGDHVVYRMQKHSSKPGPRARSINPSDHGELYTYLVDKYWIVAEVGDGKLVLKTRTGKIHTVSKNDPCLRKLKWWERLLHRQKLPSLEA